MQLRGRISGFCQLRGLKHVFNSRRCAFFTCFSSSLIRFLGRGQEHHMWKDVEETDGLLVQEHILPCTWLRSSFFLGSILPTPWGSVPKGTGSVPNARHWIERRPGSPNEKRSRSRSDRRKVFLRETTQTPLARDELVKVPRDWSDLIRSVGSVSSLFG